MQGHQIFPIKRHINRYIVGAIYSGSLFPNFVSSKIFSMVMKNMASKKFHNFSLDFLSLTVYIPNQCRFTNWGRSEKGFASCRDLVFFIEEEVENSNTRQSRKFPLAEELTKKFAVSLYRERNTIYSNHPNTSRRRWY